MCKWVCRHKEETVGQNEYKLLCVHLKMLCSMIGFLCLICFLSLCVCVCVQACVCVFTLCACLYMLLGHIPCGPPKLT